MVVQRSPLVDAKHVEALMSKYFKHCEDDESIMCVAALHCCLVHSVLSGLLHRIRYLFGSLQDVVNAVLGRIEPVIL